MVHEETLTIGYRDWQGEPRGKQAVAGNGDCITCGLCIDACNDLIDRIDKPRELIGYMALTDEVRERAGKPAKSVWAHMFRPRTMMYTVIWAAIGVGLVMALFLRSPIDISVTPVRNPTFVTLSDGSIRNAYDIRLRNKQGDAETYAIFVTLDDTVTLSLEGTEALTVTVPANETQTQRVYLTAATGSVAALSDRSGEGLWVQEQGAIDRVHHDTIFNGKGQ